MRKEFVGAAPRTKLTAQLASSTGVGGTFTVEDGAGYPVGTYPFVISVSRGLPGEEKILCSARAGNSFTILQRGYDGTLAATHPIDAVVYHVLDSITLDEANSFTEAHGALTHAPITTTQYPASEPLATYPIGTSIQLVGTMHAATYPEGLSGTLLTVKTATTRGSQLFLTANGQRVWNRGVNVLDVATWEPWVELATREWSKQIELSTDTVSRTVTASDMGKLLQQNIATATTVTVPTPDSLGVPLGSTFSILQGGVGAVTVDTDGSAALFSFNGSTNASTFDIAERWGLVTLIARSLTQWVVKGDVA